MTTFSTLTTLEDLARSADPAKDSTFTQISERRKPSARITLSEYRPQLRKHIVGKDRLCPIRNQINKELKAYV